MSKEPNLKRISLKLHNEKTVYFSNIVCWIVCLAYLGVAGQKMMLLKKNAASKNRNKLWNYSVFSSVSMLKTVFAQPFFNNGIACPATFRVFKNGSSTLISSPHAIPTTPS